MVEYYISWWNVENLFDVESSPERFPKLDRILKKELQGWDANVLDQKLLQLANVIQKLNNNNGPDLIGVCEIENASVLKKLKNKINISGRDYQIIHHDCNDKRGIDVAFIYDNKKFIVDQDFSHEILKRTATRDIYQVNFKTEPKGNDLVVIGNHWPSRSGGVYKTEPYRILAGETLAYFHLRIKEVMKGKANIFIMGDFNDEPFDRSLYEYALSSRNKQKVLRAKSPIRLYNLMWSLMDKGFGTYYYQNFPFTFDQFLVTKNFLKDNKPFSVKENSIEIVQYLEMKKGTYNIPKLFGRPSRKNLDTNGYSDHFPIAVVITEV